MENLEHLPITPLGKEVTLNQGNAAMPVGRERTRLQIDVDPKHLARIENLMKECGLSTKKELFEYGVTLLEWAAKHSQHKRVIGAINPDDGSYIELQMPPLSNAALNAA